MVRIHVKSGDDSGENEFLYECQSDSLIKEIASDVIQIFNLQSKIHRLVSEFEPRLLPFHGDPKVTPLLRAFWEAKSYASKDMVIHDRPLSYLVLRHHFETIERELVAKFDLLGDSDSTQYQQILSGDKKRDCLLSHPSDVELLDENTTQLKLAGKELKREKQLCDYIGRNEKIKIVLKLQPKIMPLS
ncbi:cilia- and flagella-associated protein 298-like isoform X1 [Benincasa hispida]|uniref:cilia- and flagella-associated protein 298-like isoform X1 n=1 Tax=Benincasa hispida TaxID=102211 RepID=UPI0018FFCF57|nr:cilia- and flagella-associated protein 298-like isoform X1 [Benincasa hispida]